MSQRSFYKLLFLLLILTVGFSIAAQSNGTGTTSKKPAAKATPTPKTAVVAADNDAPAKKNSRPAVDDLSDPAKKNIETSPIADQTKPPAVYFYEFSQPEFIFSKVFVEHDENGAGSVRFQKQYFAEEISEPIQLSAATIEKVKAIWRSLNFLDSSEDYQYERDYSHLGKMKFTMRKDGRERTAEFNWTANPDAKALADEYRRIGNQRIWLFEINVSRENQPLESARIIDSLDLQLKRRDISDPEQLLPFLKELSDDERIPLLSRNHAARIAKEIEREAAKRKQDQNQQP